MIIINGQRYVVSETHDDYVILDNFRDKKLKIDGSKALGFFAGDIDILLPDSVVEGLVYEPQDVSQKLDEVLHHPSCKCVKCLR